VQVTEAEEEKVGEQGGGPAEEAAREGRCGKASRTVPAKSGGGGGWADAGGGWRSGREREDAAKPPEVGKKFFFL
jgi:hypothetical protein